MTHVGTSAAAIGLAAFVSLSSLCAARADTPAPVSAEPSLSEPAPTPGWAEAGPTSMKRTAVVRHPTHVYAHRAWRGHRYVHRDNPIGDVATGLVGGVADLGSVAAYPFYCFPNYGSCPMRVPYRP